MAPTTVAPLRARDKSCRYGTARHGLAAPGCATDAVRSTAAVRATRPTAPYRSQWLACPILSHASRFAASDDVTSIRTAVGFRSGWLPATTTSAPTRAREIGEALDDDAGQLEFDGRRE